MLSLSLYYYHRISHYGEEKRDLRCVAAVKLLACEVAVVVLIGAAVATAVADANWTKKSSVKQRALSEGIDIETECVSLSGIAMQAWKRRCDRP